MQSSARCCNNYATSVINCTLFCLTLARLFSLKLSERFQRKRVGTLENVISDLKRFRDMNSKGDGETNNKFM